MNNLKINEEELNFLRNNTKLSVIALAKIKRIKRQIDEYCKWYYRNEGELLEADYTPADLLEYQLRQKAWEQSLESLWKKNPDGLDLAEFAKMSMQQQLPNKRHK